MDVQYWWRITYWLYETSKKITLKYPCHFGRHILCTNRVILLWITAYSAHKDICLLIYIILQWNDWVFVCVCELFSSILWNRGETKSSHVTDRRWTTDQNASATSLDHVRTTLCNVRVGAPNKMPRHLEATFLLLAAIDWTDPVNWRTSASYFVSYLSRLCGVDDETTRRLWRYDDN